VRKHRGVRDARYKLMRFFEDPEEYELYDLAKDPDETKNLANDPAQSVTLTRLLARLEQLRAELGDDDATLARWIEGM
jgi:arylsulfatase A-like enzyme